MVIFVGEKENGMTISLSDLTLRHVFNVELLLEPFLWVHNVHFLRPCIFRPISGSINQWPISKPLVTQT